MNDRNKREAELREEIAFHLDAEAHDREAEGLGAIEAGQAARRDPGNLGRVLEDTRAVWGWTFFDMWLQDWRYALRFLRKNLCDLNHIFAANKA